MEVTLTDLEFARFRDLIYQTAGIALSDGKRQMVQSRLQKRLRLHHLAASDYYALLTGPRRPDDEMTAFINCITTNKTDFFREPHHFSFVAERILPEIAARAGHRTPRLRVWHAGCSTGEEPYTLALTLAEALDRPEGNIQQWDIQQLASDIDTDVLVHAEQGVYAAERVAPIPLPCLRRHFLAGCGEAGALYQIKPALRAQITFRQINLLHDWPLRPGTRFDIIFCRNVVIYFDKPTQSRLFARLEAHLSPGGYLILGHSESLHGTAGRFESLGHTIYRKCAGIEKRVDKPSFDAV